MAASVAASMSMLPPVDSPAESLRKVQTALAGGTAEDALGAAITLDYCASFADKMVNGLMQGRDTAAQAPPEVRKASESFPATNAMIARAQADQRRCQVFDAATLDRRGELFQKAYEGRADGAALFYLTWLNSEREGKAKVDPELAGRLQAAVRADAQAADLVTLVSFTYGGRTMADQVGASPVEAQAYKEAYLRIIDESSPAGSASTRDLVAKLSVLVPKQPALTQEEQRAADALTGQVVDAWHRRMQKGG